MMRYKWTILGAIILVAIIFLAQGRDDLSNAPVPSTHSRHDRGLAVAWHWLHNVLPEPPRRLQEEWTSLQSSGTGNVLFVNGPLKTSAGGDESQALVSWISKGNTLVLSHFPGDDSDVELRRALGIRPLESMNGPHDIPLERMILEPASPDCLLRDVRTIVAMPLPLYPDWVKLPLLESRPMARSFDGVDVTYPYATRRPVGQGAVILLSQSELWSNKLIHQFDNWILLLNVAELRSGGGKVWFDEYHLAENGGNALFSRSGKLALMIIGVQAVLAAAVFILSRRRRFGPVKMLSNHAGRSQLEFVSALADLYRRSSARQYALARMYEGLVRDVSALEPRSRRPQPADLAVAISQRGKLDLRDAEELLNEIHNALHQPDLSRRRLMRLGRRIANLRKEIRLP